MRFVSIGVHLSNLKEHSRGNDGVLLGTKSRSMICGHPEAPT